MRALPPVRVDNWILFPGGHSRRMTWFERLRWFFGHRSFK